MNRNCNCLDIPWSREISQCISSKLGKNPITYFQKNHVHKKLYHCSNATKFSGTAEGSLMENNAGCRKTLQGMNMQVPSSHNDEKVFQLSKNKTLLDKKHS